MKWKFWKKELDEPTGNPSREYELTPESLLRMIFENMTPFLKLGRDSKMIEVITDGYEVSSDVFSIGSKVSTMFSQVPYKVMRGETEIDQGPLERLFEDDPADYTFTEFMRDWELFGMITGNSIVYHLTRTGSIRGDGQFLQFQLAPSQHVEIEYGGFDNPVKSYMLDLSPAEKKGIPPENMWHVRQFANLDYRQGKNYMGISPIKVAAKIVNSQIWGQELVQNTFKRGMPPGILTRKNAADFQGMDLETERKEIEAIWDRKYAQRNRAGKPIFTVGDMSWLPIGFSSMRDLQWKDVQVMGLRALCNVWGIPSRVMNDMEGGSYTKDKEDRKAIYTNRIIPDMKMFWDGINKLIKNTGIRYKPDYSDIPELQEDKKEKAEIYQILWNSNLLKVGEGREAFGLEMDPEMENVYRDQLNPGMQLPNNIL